MTNDLWYGTSGPPDAEIVLVGEAWGIEESSAKKPFVGGAGTELTRMLAEAGLSRDRILLTNIVAARPQNNQMWRFFDGSDTIRGLNPSKLVLDGLDRLQRQICAHPRRLVIGAGNYPLWALSDVAGTGPAPDKEAPPGTKVPTGIMSWRGSMWWTKALSGPPIPFLPVIHPAAILRQWSLRAVTVHDLKARVPMALRGDWRPRNPPVFWAPPTFEQATMKLRSWIARADAGHKLRLMCDIENARFPKIITCIGFTDSSDFGMTIPFINLNGRLFVDYWPHEQEVVLIDLMRRALDHENILIEGQNFAYDAQFIYTYLAVKPRLDFDSMLAHHMLWPGTPKGLDYLSSLYCKYHWYWKDDNKEWDIKGDLYQHLNYNCMDLVRNFEVNTALRKLIPQLNMERQWLETMDRAHLALRMMYRGVKIDRNRRAEIGRQLAEHYNRIAHELDTIIPLWMLPPDILPKPKRKGERPTPWYTSTKQQKFIFGELLGMKLPRNRDTGRDTLNKDALRTLAKQRPEFTGIFERLEDLRSVGVFQSHFISAPLSTDDRMRCSYNVSGTETFRWSSSKNPFGEGANLQTIPAGDED